MGFTGDFNTRREAWKDQTDWFYKPESNLYVVNNQQPFMLTRDKKTGHWGLLYGLIEYVRGVYLIKLMTHLEGPYLQDKVPKDLWEKFKTNPLPGEFVNKWIKQTESKGMVRDF